MFRKLPKIAGLLAAGAIIAAVLAGCGSALGEGNVAKVYDKNITEAEMKKRAEMLALKAGEVEVTDELLAAKFNANAVHQLVVEELLKREAANRGIEIPEDEVQASFDFIADTNFGGDKEVLLAVLQATEEEVKEGLRVQIIDKNLREAIAAEVEVTDEDIRAAYQKFVDSYKTPEFRRLGVIVAGDEAAAQQAKQRLEAGEDLGKLVSEYSVDPATKSKQGVVSLQKTREDVLPPDIKAVAFSTVIGGIAGPVKSEKGYYVIRVQEVEPDKDTPFELVEPMFRARAREEKFNQMWDNFVRELEEKANAVYRDDVKPV